MPIATVLECAQALRARLASGLAAGTAGECARTFTTTAVLSRFRRGPEQTVRYEDGAEGRPGVAVLLVRAQCGGLDAVVFILAPEGFEGMLQMLQCVILPAPVEAAWLLNSVLTGVCTGVQHPMAVPSQTLWRRCALSSYRETVLECDLLYAARSRRLQSWHARKPW